MNSFVLAIRHRSGALLLYPVQQLVQNTRDGIDGVPEIPWHCNVDFSIRFMAVDPPIFVPTYPITAVRV